MIALRTEMLFVVMLLIATKKSTAIQVKSAQSVFSGTANNIV